eukprot:scaffold28323_cov112-Isochrysis_galbana.AAC.1
MELKPPDARDAPSASAPTTMSMAMPLPPRHPRSPGKGNMVSQRATLAAPLSESALSEGTPPVGP